MSELEKFLGASTGMGAGGAAGGEGYESLWYIHVGVVINIWGCKCSDVGVDTSCIIQTSTKWDV